MVDGGRRRDRAVDLLRVAGGNAVDLVAVERRAHDQLVVVFDPLVTDRDCSHSVPSSPSSSLLIAAQGGLLSAAQDGW